MLEQKLITKISQWNGKVGQDDQNNPLVTSKIVE